MITLTVVVRNSILVCTISRKLKWWGFSSLPRIVRTDMARIKCRILRVQCRIRWLVKRLKIGWRGQAWANIMSGLRKCHTIIIKFTIVVILCLTMMIIINMKHSSDNWKVLTTTRISILVIIRGSELSLFRDSHNRFNNNFSIIRDIHSNTNMAAIMQIIITECRIILSY